MRVYDLMESRFGRTRLTAEDIGGELYHGTSVFACINMLAQDKIVGRTDRLGITGVSCTTKLDWAQNYARSKTWGAFEKFAPRDQVEARHVGPHRLSNGPVLVLDGPAIAKDFEVYAVAWSKTAPLEERIWGNLTSLHVYLREIRVDRETIEAYRTALEVRASDRGPWKERLAGLKALEGSGLLRAQ